jgi:DNA-directed RNA polymerase subunit M/transcription elongation factor TFIIS
MTIFNATVRAQGEAGLDATWNDVFKGEYKRLAAAVTGNLTESRGTLTAIWTCWAASSGARRQVGRRHVPSSMRPHVFEGLDTMSERLSKATLRNTGAVSTMFACPKCKERNCSYTELQTRSADEGTTIFLFCHTCSTQWTQGG